MALSTTSAASTAASSSSPIIPSVQACIVGGGIGGCAAAASLLASTSPRSAPLKVMVLEMGRGVGGRASTRFTRDDDRIAVNHGAPHAEIQTAEGLAIMEQLQAGGFAQPSTTSISSGSSGSSGSSSSSSSADAEDSTKPDSTYWTGNPTMHRLAEGLLETLDHPPTKLFRAMVRQVEPIIISIRDAAESESSVQVQGWRLKDKDGNILVETEWLILAGSGMAHPRWTAAFGGEPPLLTAAKQIGSSELNKVLATIGSVHSRPVQAAMMAFDLKDVNSSSNNNGESIAFWKDIMKESKVLETPGDEILDKLVFQTTDGGTLLTVVAHSNAAFAETAKDTYGSKSTAATIGGATSSADREEEVLATLVDAVQRVILSHTTNTNDGEVCPAPAWGPFLHRWGNAFPEGSSLLMEDAIVEDAKIAFCGDYTGPQERFGTLEGALLSGNEVGKRLQRILNAPQQ